MQHVVVGRSLVSLAVASILFLPREAVAENKKPSAASSKPRASESKSDFDLFGATPAPMAAVAAPDPRIAKRRQLLTLHQTLGLVTAAGMIGTTVLGQLNYNDRFGGGFSTGRFELVHAAAATGTTVAFATAGVLAWLAPVPFEKKTAHGFDSLTIHKICMAGATVGMATEMGLGLWTTLHEGRLDQVALAQTHLAIGYATAGLLVTGALALVFMSE